MTLLLTLLAGVILTFSGCEKIEKGTPKCIKKKIRKDKKEWPFWSKVYEYDYNGQKVYFFIPENYPDATSVLYDESCNQICTFGGLSGGGTGSCPDFKTLRTNEKLIWQE